MRRLVLVTVLLAAASAAAPAAHAGTPIKKLSSCNDSYLWVNDTTSMPTFRAALLCLINAARKTQHLPALKRDSRLESVAQAQSDKFQKTGSGSHGKTLAEIGKRFERKGYKPAAYNEAFSMLFGSASPYGFLREMMKARQVPCSEILDPRFRDIGIGMTPGSLATTLTLEFGLKRGAKQPSNDFTKSASCPHTVPSPAFSEPPLTPAVPDPSASGDTVTLGLKCAAKQDCVVTGTLELIHSHTKANSSVTQTIPAGQSAALSFTFDAAAVQTELQTYEPGVSLSLSVTKPMTYTDVLTGPLAGA